MPPFIYIHLRSSSIVCHQVMRFKVKFDSPRVTANKNRIVSGSEVAYPEQSTVRLHVGVRVVAAFRHTQQQTPTFYSGTIAEAPKAMNGYRCVVEEGRYVREM